MKKSLLVALTLTLAFSFICTGALTAYAAETEKSADNADNLNITAQSALLMDYDTGTVVYSKEATKHLPIASMVKIMTLLITMEEIDEGRLATSDLICASENAASMGGSQAFLDAHSSYEAGELIKSIVVGSANDSCVALAEHISGSVEAFVLKMNEKARLLGMNDTLFVNCTGLPAAEQYCCARDVAIMTRALISHPRFFDYSTVWMFDFAHPSGRITQLSNTNKLIRAYEGCDGGKTGFTNEAKYCLSATAKRGNTRLISVVCGAETSKIRNAQNAALFNYGFSLYETRQVAFKGVAIEGDFAIEGGKEEFIKAIAASDGYLFIKKGAAQIEYKVEVNKLKAPLNKGDYIGSVTACAGEACVTVPLVSDRTVLKPTYSDFLDRFIAEW